MITVAVRYYIDRCGAGAPTPSCLHEAITKNTGSSPAIYLIADLYLRKQTNLDGSSFALEFSSQ